MDMQKLPQSVYQFYTYANYPHIPGEQVDLFWNGLELEGYNVWIVEMHRLARSRRQEHVGGSGHANSATARDAVIRLCRGNTADEVGAESARATDSESDGKLFWFPGIH